MSKIGQDLYLKFGEASLFVEENPIDSAVFNLNKTYRYCLIRTWDKSKPFVMFIGLNPSTADGINNDATIRRCKTLAFNLGYGGLYMLNCFAFISTDPKKLVYDPELIERNNDWLETISKKCADVVFCWGNFKIVKETKRDQEIIKMFPDAKVLGLNKNGSPKHPLYMPSDTKLISYSDAIELQMQYYKIIKLQNK